MQVHCKAGKGRTGLILICYLLYGGLRRTALSARAFYDSQRTLDNKGLTIISQVVRVRMLAMADGEWWSWSWP